MSERIATEIDGLPLALSNLDKPLFPSGFTKGELIAYYVEIADTMLPHLRERALTRVRFPNGTSGESFYEKNVPPGAPSWVSSVDVATSAGTVNLRHRHQARRPGLVGQPGLRRTPHPPVAGQ